MNIKFTVETTPYPQPRPRVTHGHAYEPRRITNYKRMIGLRGRNVMRGRPSFSTPIHVALTVRRNIKVDSHNFGDADNHAKAVLDALNGVCYEDDASIVSLSVRKEKSEHEGVDIFISDEEDYHADR